MLAATVAHIKCRRTEAAASNQLLFARGPRAKLCGTDKRHSRVRLAEPFPAASSTQLPWTRAPEPHPLNPARSKRSSPLAELSLEPIFHALLLAVIAVGVGAAAVAVVGVAGRGEVHLCAQQHGRGGTGGTGASTHSHPRSEVRGRAAPGQRGSGAAGQRGSGAAGLQLLLLRRRALSRGGHGRLTVPR